ncbi:Tumor necrosis factor receptor superfamily member 13B [Labeo rohita]|uniref:Tumor necrosis factor receptor superfamily member 13B n=2 Tax=Labeo rohita TaxID=84645 RepID=A0ABQ8M887_LABRO|nr:Tumor necrosis factor receptor superfamily member 13B [Labeo rohita]
MAQSCPEGQYLDSLLRKCMSCSLVCHDIKIQNRCSEYCVAWKCKAVSGQFYDTLLKKCLRCSELCGSHPAPCADACRSAVSVTQRPVGGSAVQLVTGRGRSVAGSALYSEALLYGLLGLCITVLMFTLTAAIMLLLKRAKHQQQLDTKKQQPNKQGQSSKDSLMARADEVSQEGSVTQDRPRATETCIYCFSEHTVAPRTLYQQAGAQEPVRAAAAAAAENLHHDNGAPHQPLQTHADKSRAFRIICSPTQTSM